MAAMDRPRRDWVPAPLDMKLISDAALLQNLLKGEDKNLPTPNYFGTIQTEAQPFMRGVLVKWMLDVSREERCEPDVFPLACRYLDRFLSTVAVHTAQLQVLGATCLFCASKIRQIMPLKAPKLVSYAAGAFDLSELLSWELLLLGRLRWDVTGITPLDFLPPLCYNLGLTVDAVRPTFCHLVDQVCLELKLAVLPSSAIASGCLCAAIERVSGQADVVHAILEELRAVICGDNEVGLSYVDAILQFLNEDAGATGGSKVTAAGQGSQPGTPTEVENVTLT